MADNIPVTPGVGVTIAADDIGGLLHQRIKVVLGNDNTSNGDISSTNPMPTLDTATISIDTKIPALGQALASASTPVVLPIAQISSLVPLTPLITAAAPYSQRLSDGTAFYDARQVRALTSADQVTLANPSIPITNTLETSSTGTISSAPIVATSFPVLAANSARKGFIIINDGGTGNCSVAFAATATATAFTLRLTAGQSYFSTTFPIYRGIITAIGASAGGNLRITELT